MIFDAYGEFLDIPKAEQPPTHYRLLGVAPEETDATVIFDAAKRRAAQVRKYMEGPHAEEAKQLWHQIKRAAATLSDVQKRQQYDATLATISAPPIEHDQTAPNVQRSSSRRALISAVVALQVLLVGLIAGWFLWFAQPSRHA